MSSINKISIPLDPIPEAHQPPLWYRVIDRFGMPTLFVILLLVGFVYYNRQVREDTKEDRQIFVAAIKENTAAINNLAQELRVNNELVRNRRF